MKTLSILIICISLSLAGCVPFPRYATVQPDLEIKVTDPNGAPISGAEVLLVNAYYPHRGIHSKQIKITGTDGVVRLHRKAEWEIIYPFMLHGVNNYYLTWCISKEGYISQLEEISEKSFTTTLSLTKGQSMKCINDEGYVWITRKPN